MVRYFSSYLLAIFVLAAGLSNSAWSDEVEDCLKGQGYVQIQGCSAIISTKKAFGLPITRKNLAIAYFNRATAYDRTAENSKALADYNKVIALKPKNTLAYNQQGLLYIKMKDYDRAVDSFNRALETDPNYRNAFTSRAIVYRLKSESAS